MSSNTLLILGASSDIGQRLIKEVGSNYERIIVHYRRSNSFVDDLKKTVQAEIVEMQADFSDMESTSLFVENLGKYEDEIEHIVHLPAISARPEKFHKVKWEDIENNFSVSYRSIVMVLKKLMPKMIKRKKGKIVFMLSAYTENLPPKYESIYVSSKYALLGLMKSLARDYADKNIQINGVSPEMIETKFLNDISEHIVYQNAQENPMGRNLIVEDVVPTIAFLLSNKSDCLTGQNIVITGGK